MASFPEMFLNGYFSPSRFETDISDCIIVGEIPEELDGSFYRMHGDWLYMPMRFDDIPLAADGYMSAVRIKNQKASYVGKYVRTERYLNQEKAGGQLYGYYRNAYDDDPSVQDIENPHRRTTANTTPVILNNRLFATKEDGLPYELDPNTLETIGETDFDGSWNSQTFTAHPKYDYSTGETFSYGYESKGAATKDLYVASFNKDGEITWELETEVPYVSMVHDQAIAGDYIIIPAGGTVTSLERLQEGKPHWAWDSKLPSYHLVIPKGGKPEDVRTFYAPERCWVHTANAWQEGDTLVMDAPLADKSIWPWFEDVDGKEFDMGVQLLRRFTYDLASNSDEVHEEILFDTPVTSFSRVDDRFLGKKTRYIWIQYWDQSQPFTGQLPPGSMLAPENTFSLFDTEERTEKKWFAGPEYVLQEPVFIPRSEDAPEGDGFLIGTAHNLIQMRAEIVILDAMKMEELARVILPFKNAFQVHGVWANAGDLSLK
jgi:carotenoid cleavage dioxygenase